MAFEFLLARKVGRSYVAPFVGHIWSVSASLLSFPSPVDGRGSAPARVRARKRSAVFLFPLSRQRERGASARVRARKRSAAFPLYPCHVLFTKRIAERVKSMINNSEAFIERARELRRNQTDAETFFWAIVRNRAFGGFKFRRQKIVGSYILDF